MIHSQLEQKWQAWYTFPCFIYHDSFDEMLMLKRNGWFLLSQMNASCCDCFQRHKGLSDIAGVMPMKNGVAKLTLFEELILNI